MGRIYIHKLCPLEPMLLIEWHGTVENCFTGNSMIADGWGISWVIGRIQRMTAYPRNAYYTGISLHTGIHSPDNIVDIKWVYILIYKDHQL